jgi:nitrate reductase cytochrome c-type subunit
MECQTDIIHHEWKTSLKVKADKVCYFFIQDRNGNLLQSFFPQRWNCSTCYCSANGRNQISGQISAYPLAGLIA